MPFGIIAKNRPIKKVVTSDGCQLAISLGASTVPMSTLYVYVTDISLSDAIVHHPNNIM